MGLEPLWGLVGLEPLWDLSGTGHPCGYRGRTESKGELEVREGFPRGHKDTDVDGNPTPTRGSDPTVGLKEDSRSGHSIDGCPVETSLQRTVELFSGTDVDWSGRLGFEERGQRPKLLLEMVGSPLSIGSVEKVGFLREEQLKWRIQGTEVHKDRGDSRGVTSSTGRE